MHFKLGWKRFLIFLITFGVFYLVLNPADAVTFAVILLLSFLLIAPFYRLYKKHFVRPIVVWDIHGVYITGDMQVENLYEVQGTRDLIQRVRENYYVACFTNFNPELFDFYSRKWGWHEMYDELYYSGKLRARKPNKEAFEKVLRGLGVSGKDIVFIDDVEENVKAANSLGIKGIQFKNPQDVEKKFREMGLKF